MVPKVWLLIHFGLNLGLDFNRLCLKSGKDFYIVLSGTRKYVFFSRRNAFVIIHLDHVYNSFGKITSFFTDK